MAENNQEKEHQPVIMQPAVLSQIDKIDLDETEYDTLVQMGIEVGEVSIYAKWIWGKLGSAVSKKHEGNLTQYAKDIGVPFNSLKSYVTTYRKFTAEDPEFTPDKYVGSIPWGVLQLVAAKSDKPQALLEELQDKGLDRSIEGATRGIHEHEDPNGDKVPSKPKVQLKWDPEVHKYKLNMNPEDFQYIDWTDVREQLAEYLNSLS